ncbi:MAG: pilin [Clostridia bacterium]|nr:pilin [Clostridia bacterium]
MKKWNEKRICGALAMVMVFALVLAVGVNASGFDDVVKPIVELLNSLMTPILAIVGAAGALYCILLGVKYAKAEEPQDREKAKSHLKNAIIGFVLIFVLILALKLLMPVMIDWVNANS